MELRTMKVEEYHPFSAIVCITLQSFSAGE